MTQPAPDLVGLYARLTLTAQRYVAAGQPVPDALVRAVQGIEARAKTLMSPEQLEAAMHHVEVAKMRITHEENQAETARNARERQRVLDEGTRRLTRGMAGQNNGLSYAEFEAVRQGKPLPTVKRLSQQERDAQARQMSRNLDPHGQGWTEAEMARRFDELADANDKNFSRLASGYLASPEQLKETAKRWKSERVEYGLKQRREARGPSQESAPVVNDNTRRRAQLVESYLQNVKTDKDVQGVFDEIPERMQEDTGRIGDIAAAWATHENAASDSESNGASTSE